MVKVIDVVLRENKEKGKQFACLIVQGDIVPLQSMTTGKFYLSAKKASVATTFDEDTARGLIGTQIPGKIERVQTDPYDLVVEGGEVLTLNYRFEYLPESVPSPTVPMHVVRDQELVA